MLSNIFNTILYNPLFNGLIALYNFIPGHDLGVAIIVLTILIRFVLYPLSAKSLKAQREMQKLQPELKKIQDLHSGDAQAKQKAVMEFYKKNKINPMSSCLPLLIQFPILIALYRVFITGLNGEKFDALYSFVPAPEHFSSMFFGVLDLSQKNIFLAILAGALQYLQSKMLIKQKPNIQPVKKEAEKSNQPNFASMMNKQMLYFMPIFTVFIAASLPAGLALYWVATTLFSIFQQIFLLRKEKANG